MKTLFLSNMSKSRSLTSTFFPISVMAWGLDIGDAKSTTSIGIDGVKLWDASGVPYYGFNCGLEMGLGNSKHELDGWKYSKGRFLGVKISIWQNVLGMQHDSNATIQLGKCKVCDINTWCCHNTVVKSATLLISPMPFNIENIEINHFCLLFSKYVTS